MLQAYNRMRQAWAQDPIRTPAVGATGVAAGAPPARSRWDRFALQAEHEFKSLVGWQVSVPKPTQIDTVEEAAVRALHGLTRKDLSRVDALATLGELYDYISAHNEKHPDHPIDVNKALRQQVDGLNDLQVLRLHRNMCAHLDALETLPSAAEKIAPKTSEHGIFTRVGGKIKPEDNGHEVAAKVAHKLDEISAYATQVGGAMLNKAKAENIAVTHPQDHGRIGIMPGDLKQMSVQMVEARGDVRLAFEQLRTAKIIDAMNKL